MAHRNRWFTELKNSDFPWQTVSHNQVGYFFKKIWVKSCCPLSPSVQPTCRARWLQRVGHTQGRWSKGLGSDFPRIWSWANNPPVGHPATKCSWLPAPRGRDSCPPRRLDIKKRYYRLQSWSSSSQWLCLSLTLILSCRKWIKWSPVWLYNIRIIRQRLILLLGPALWCPA